ncbi:Mitochondrial beta-keto-acyl synthase [Lobaria immixta]|nr:Mitochondrial beta-keto-acyl synthase [Lobaria immixta]
MLAGGAESCIHPLAFTGFERSRSLTTAFNDNPEQASRPFDAARDGFVIGEGAAVLVLEALPHALARSAHIYAELVGYGSSSDAHHLTAPPASGSGAYRAMRLALQHASLAPSTVDYINAHATSTPLGDAAENRAIKVLMLGSEGKAKPAEVNISSTKGAVGHLLGAAGAIESIFSILAIRDNTFPPTLNLNTLSSPSFEDGLDDEFNCNYVPRTAQAQRADSVDVVLSNSFGFGGTNASLCFRRFRG